MDTKGRVIGHFSRPIGGVSTGTTPGDYQIAFDVYNDIIYMQADNGGQLVIEAFDCSSESFIDMTWSYNYMPSGIPARCRIHVDSYSSIVYILEYGNSYNLYGINVKSKSQAFLINNISPQNWNYPESWTSFPVNNGREIFVWRYEQDFILIDNSSLNVDLKYVVDSIESKLLPSAFIENTNLSTIYVNGVFVNKPIDAYQFLELLMSVYFFDIAEIDGKLTAQPKASRIPITTITEDDMLDDLQISNQSRLELPTTVSLSYIDKANDYQQSEQHVDKVTEALSGRTNKISLDVPISLNSDEAALVVDYMMAEAYTASTRFSFSLPMRYLELSPSDVITINYKGTYYDVLIRKIGYSSSGKRLFVICKGGTYKV